MTIKTKNIFVSENSASYFLIGATLFALVCANTSLSSVYEAFFSYEIFSNTILFWINEGLMTLFFLVIGLELKREILFGELNSAVKILLPGWAAVGGMLLPALIYLFFNYGDPLNLKGWGIPVATDIAFALSVLNAFGKRIPIGLKTFLLALAIFDDIGAIIIIAFFYSAYLDSLFVLFALFSTFVIARLKKLKQKSLPLYLIAGCILWAFLLKSGIHATLAGVILGLCIPINASTSPKQARFNQFEHRLKPWVDYFVLPIFAFANAGLSLYTMTKETFSQPVFLGIFFGLFVGKQIGIYGFSRVLIGLGWAKLPAKTSWGQIYAVSVICGIGFTMSLFVGLLSFGAAPGEYVNYVRSGVLFGSVISAAWGATVLAISLKQSN